MVHLCQSCGSQFGRARSRRRKSARRSNKVKDPNRKVKYTGKRPKKYFLDMIKKHQDYITEIEPQYGSENIIPYHEGIIKRYKEIVADMK